MAEKKQTYSQYVNKLSPVRVTMLSLLSGFAFTTIMLLLKDLPDPSSTASSVALFFLTVIFDLLLFLLGWQIYITIGLYDVPDPPPHSKWELSAFNGTLLLVFYMWGASPVMIYLVWNLNILAIVSGMAWTVLVILSLYIGRHVTRRLGWSMKDELRKIQQRA